jgi:hypothetical protein
LSEAENAEHPSMYISSSNTHLLSST